MSDDEILDVEHNHLLSDVNSILNNKDVKKPRVKVLKTPSASNNLLSDLVGSLKSTKNLGTLKEDLNVAKDVNVKNSTRRQKPARKSTKLSVPLHRHEQARVEAEAGLKDLRKDLRAWDSVVQGNRSAEQLHFPLDAPQTFYAEPVAEKTNSFVPRTNLETRLAETLGQSKNVLGNDQLYTEEETQLLKALNLKQAKEKTTQLQKLRATMSFRAAKYARDAKIKSKKYHRLRKKEERRKLIKEIEDLLATDPEAAKEKLKELETDRAYERATLKHRSTNKWSVQLKQYAAKNPEMQKLISEHLNLGREIKKRRGQMDSDEEQDETPKVTKGEVLQLAAEQARREVGQDIEKGSSKPELMEGLKRVKARLENVQVEFEPVDGIMDTAEDVVNDDFLANAFDGDDVLADFEKEKKEEEERTKKKDDDSRLFGWGDWTGEGINMDAQLKRKQKFLKKAKQAPRFDRRNSKLIVREGIVKQVEKLQPSNVPFPFTTVKDFEAVIRQPIGRDWNTNLAHKQLVAKAVKTTPGRIISAMDVKTKGKSEELDDEFTEILG